MFIIAIAIYHHSAAVKYIHINYSCFGGSTATRSRSRKNIAYSKLSSFQTNFANYAFINQPLTKSNVSTEPNTTIIGGPDIYINTGSTVNLTCIISQSPEPPQSIEWTHNHVVSILFGSCFICIMDCIVFTAASGVIQWVGGYFCIKLFIN